MSRSYCTARVFGGLVCFAFAVHLADASTQWARTIGGMSTDWAWAVSPTSDGGHILAGLTSSSGAGGLDAWCLKLDDSGSILWQKTYGGASDDTALALQTTSDGGYIFAGNTKSFGAKSPWCVKLDSSGNVLWQKIYSGVNEAEARCVQATSDGGYIIAGSTWFTGYVDRDPWCAKLDSFGNVLWQKRFGGAWGGEMISVEQTSDGDYILAGGTSTSGIDSEVLCMKLDSSGNVLWQKTYGGASNDAVYAAQATSDGGCIFVGLTYSFLVAGHDRWPDAWCVKLDSSGNVSWQKSYGGAFEDFFSAVQATSDGGYILAGETAQNGDSSDADAWCVKLDSSGNILWQKKYGGAFYEDAWDVEATSDGGYILVAYTQSFGVDNNDVLCLKLNSAGEIGPSCASLVSNSIASTGVSTAVAAVTTRSLGFTTVTGIATSAIVTSSTATTTVLCSGGTEGPAISSIKSKTNKPGSSAIIYGTGFSTDKKKDVVYFGTKKVKFLGRVKATSLKLTIPRLEQGTVGVFVVVNGEASNTVQFQVK